MTDTAFVVKNGLVVNSTLFVVNTASNTVSVANAINIGTGTVGTINATFYSGEANSANNIAGIGGVSAANVVSNSQLQANLANYEQKASLSTDVTAIMATNNQTVSFSNPLNWDVSHGAILSMTLTANTQINAPINLANGSYVLFLKQDGTGSRHVSSWNGIFKWPAGVVPTLSTGANAKDMFSFVYDGTNMYGSYVLGLA